MDIDYLLNKKRQQTIYAANQQMPTLPKGDMSNYKSRSPLEAYLEDITYEKQLTGGTDTPVLTGIGMGTPRKK